VDGRIRCPGRYCGRRRQDQEDQQTEDLGFRFLVPDRSAIHLGLDARKTRTNWPVTSTNQWIACHPEASLACLRGSDQGAVRKIDTHFGIMLNNAGSLRVRGFI
jgi:hypothetical protein